MDVDLHADLAAPPGRHEDAGGRLVGADDEDLEDQLRRAQRGHPLAQRSSAAPSAMKKPAASPA